MAVTSVRRDYAPAGLRSLFRLGELSGMDLGRGAFHILAQLLPRPRQNRADAVDRDVKLRADLLVGASFEIVQADNVALLAGEFLQKLANLFDGFDTAARFLVGLLLEGLVVLRQDFAGGGAASELLHARAAGDH